MPITTHPLVSTMNVRPNGGTFVLHTIGTLSLPRKVHLDSDFKLPGKTVEISVEKVKI